MVLKKDQNTGLTFQLLSKDRWKDIEKLFSCNGSCAGCWCMWWKLNRAQFDKQEGDGNKKAFKNIVAANEIPGIIAYYNNEPAGWCAIEPRENYPTLENSKLLKRIDDKAVWSIVCFFIDKKYRRKGLSIELIKAAILHAKKHKAKIIESYPVKNGANKISPSAGYHGFTSSFLRAGFKEAASPSDTRRIMRYYF